MGSDKMNEDWINTADKFYDRTNFPNVIGAVDGKHVRAVKPDNSRSKYFNYKKYFSHVLMAWVDADYVCAHRRWVSWGNERFNCF